MGIKWYSIRKSGEKYQNEYTYDRMNRIVGAVQDREEERYAYDLAGNRLKKESVQGTKNYHYNAKNQLIHIYNGENTLRYLCDKQGNLLEERGKTRRKRYSYDVANRQVSIATAGEDDTIGKLFRPTDMTERDCAMKRKRIKIFPNAS